MKMILSAIVALSASMALANPPAAPHGKAPHASKASKEMKTTTTTEEMTSEEGTGVEASAKPAVDCTMKKNMKLPECKKQTH